MPPSVEVVLNGAAGSHTDDTRRAVAEVFAACGVEAKVSVAGGGDELEEAARRALGRGARALVAGGGDGTVSAVAALVAGSGHALGVLPLGTLNHFARDLGIPLGLEEAARTVCEGTVVEVD